MGDLGVKHKRLDRPLIFQSPSWHFNYVASSSEIVYYVASSSEIVYYVTSSSEIVYYVASSSEIVYSFREKLKCTCLCHYYHI